MSRMTGTRHRPAGRSLSSLTFRESERLEREAFSRAFDERERRELEAERRENYDDPPGELPF